MALSIKNSETEALARELAAITQKPLTRAVHDALLRELGREKTLIESFQTKTRSQIAMDVGKRSAARKRLNNLSEDEILGYDKFGAPTK